jgi:hypothetical protein
MASIAWRRDPHTPMLVAAEEWLFEQLDRQRPLHKDAARDLS